MSIPDVLRRASAAIAVSGIVVTAACGSPSAQIAASRTAVAVDTDMSWDDIAALAYLLQRDDVDVKAIAIAGDGLAHCDPAFTHVRELVAALGHQPIPTGCGRTVPLSGSATFPEGWRQHADAFFGLKLPAVPDQAQTPTAVAVLSDALAATTKTTVVELGPMTNLAETLTREPALTRRIDHVYAMAGAVDVPGNEIAHAFAEWNVFIDPLAAETVLASGAAVTLVPLDATDDVPVTTFFRAALASARQTKATAVLATLLSDPYYVAGDQYLWDPAAAVVATEAGVARTARARVDVTQGDGPDRGRTAAAEDGLPVEIVQNIDQQKFYDAYLATLTGDRNARVAVPGNRLSISYSATGWSTAATPATARGPMALTFTNMTDRTVYVVVARVGGGRAIADVDALIRTPVTAVPSWVTIVLDVTTPRRHPATWSVDLESGLYVVVGGAQDLPLQRLAALQVA